MYRIYLYRITDGKEEEIIKADITDEDKAEYMISHVIPFVRE